MLIFSLSFEQLYVFTAAFSTDKFYGIDTVFLQFKPLD
jgi:hypothetical protein